MTATALHPGPQPQPAPRELWIDWFRTAGAVGIVALHVTAREMVRRARGLEGFDWWTIAGYQTVLAAAQPRPELPEYSSLWGPLDTELLAIAGGKESLDKGLGNAETAIAKLVPDYSK